MRRLVLGVALVAAGCSSILGIDDVTEGNITPDAPIMCYIEPTLNFVQATDPDTATVSNNGSNKLLTVPLNDGSPIDFFEIGLYDGEGAFSGTTVKPGTYTIDSTESSFATCGVCVIIYADTTSTGTNLNYKASYLASGGTVTITQVTPHFIATFSNLTLRHVNIASDTGVTTNVNDGCTVNIASGTVNLPYDTDLPDAGVAAPDARPDAP